ncbi:uncharacterized protein PAN0_016c5288 [Moesziomyces antarcticus]|uniref:Uncharacterized protein n=2 Tax=Pseudozyma antarctica TaxID=84753 RepID=A0A5C3FVI2_PSEA2|nr:uncharacterized protein PAN0_016c5288 [Moesziomyces antarcticus]GAK67062.1 conserved hypothetical protein [Moesziomyces antarcticus]SPO48312.1 uncharacterized protein PSANT_06001 [Moesziomyces antarcticus]
MPAASTPARKRAKLADASLPAEAEASGSESPAPRSRRRAAAQALAGIHAASTAPNQDDATDESASPRPATPVKTPSSARRKGKAKAKADDDYDDDASPRVATPAKTPRKGKGKAAEDDYDDYDDSADDAAEAGGKDPDLEIYSQHGALSTLLRAQLKTNRARSLRPLWMQGVYQPSFLGVPPSDLSSSVHDNDGDAQPEEVRSREDALPWPRDGLVRTALDPLAYPVIKKSLMSFWTSQPGWVPREGIYDWGWYPGKAVGYAQSQERAEWAARAREQLRRGAGTTNEVKLGERAGWPFVQPWLDVQREVLSDEAAARFVRDTHTPQRAPLHHPTTVMKLTVPELSMRTRLKQPPKVKTEAPDDDDDDVEEGSALDANQQPVDVADAKFSGIANLGFKEAGPVCGEVLEVCMGASGRETPVRIARGTAHRLDALGVVPDEGHVLNAGGHVYALAWAPVPIHLNYGREFLVVSASPGAPLTYIGDKQPACAASLQLWSVSPDTEHSKGTARLEMVICHEAGAAFKLAWCPVGHDHANGAHEGRRLGLLAGCFADGSVSVFSVPHPDSLQSGAGPVHVRVEPVVRLEHAQQAATSLAWAGGELLALGGARGWIGVWNVGRILRSPTPPRTPLMPDYGVRAHRSAVMDMTFVLMPPVDADGRAQTDGLPMSLFTVGADGWTALVDLSRASAVALERSRTVHYACAWAPFTSSLVHEHADGSLNHYSMRPEEMLRSRLVSNTPARVTSLAASTFHPVVAIGSAHGEVKLANTLRTLRRTVRVHTPVYQMVLDRSTGKLVVRHHLVPELANAAEAKRWHIAQWHPCLAVTAVQWNPNIGRAGLLASGTAVGMVKIDFTAPPM